MDYDPTYKILKSVGFAEIEEEESHAVDVEYCLKGWY